jgi:CBS domain-containing protein
MRFKDACKREEKRVRILKPGSVMEVTTTNVITIPPTSTIMSALKTMVAYRFRRLPIADPGTKRLEGIITGTDIINFFGGGDKHRIVEERYDNNLPAAVNEEVREIMERNVVAIDFTSSWEDALDVLLKEGVGGCPIVDRENRVRGIVTERDMLEFLATQRKFDGYVRDYMTTGVITVQPGTTIEEAMKLMISKKMRRLPIIKEGILVGLITSSTLLRYFGTKAFRTLITGDVNDVLQKPLRVMLSTIEHKEPLTFPLDARISEVAKQMIEMAYGAALILDDRRLEGIITEKDLVKFLYKVKS